MRVVGGKYKGLRFHPPRNFPSRPTTDFAKEALFNILENRLDMEKLTVLDLFAGTGSISLEFLSREVEKVISVDRNRYATQHMKKLKMDLSLGNWNIYQNDAFKAVNKVAEAVDLIFADPPFNNSKVGELPAHIMNAGCLNEGGLFILEHGRENDFQEVEGWEETRNYGGVQFSFFLFQGTSLIKKSKGA